MVPRTASQGRCHRRRLRRHVCGPRARLGLRCESPSSIATTTTCSSRCSTRWRAPHSTRPTSPHRSAAPSAARPTPRSYSPMWPASTPPPRPSGWSTAVVSTTTTASSPPVSRPPTTGRTRRGLPSPPASRPSTMPSISGSACSSPSSRPSARPTSPAGTPISPSSWSAAARRESRWPRPSPNCGDTPWRAISGTSTRARPR